MAPEANAPGKARGYADGGTVVGRGEPADGVQAMPVPDGWGSLPWFTREHERSRPQTRIDRASVRGDYPQGSPRRGRDAATRPLRSRRRGDAHVGF